MSAQQAVVIPAHRATTEGNSIRRVGGFDDALRQQLLIAPWHLTAQGGALLDSLALRRDILSDNGELAAGDVQLKVWLATAPTTAEAPSPLFAANRGVDHTLVFDGVVSLRALGKADRTTTSSAPFSVVVPFSTGFTYQAGSTLLVEFEGQPIGATGEEWWPVDAEASDVAGTVTTVGTACGATKRLADTASVIARDLVPGKTARLLFRGESSLPAVMMVGLSSVPNLLPLGTLGPGCALHLVPPFVAQIPVMTSAEELHPGLGYPAAFDLPLPGDSSVLGLAFSVQWMQFGSQQVHMSNALDLQVAGQLPGLGMALVEARATDPATMTFPPVGRVDTTTGLVIRFGHN